MVQSIRSLLFYPMRFLRVFLKRTLRLVGGLCMLGAVGLFIFGDEATNRTAWICLAVSIGIFPMVFFYDALLTRLKPTGEKIRFED